MYSYTTCNACNLYYSLASLTHCMLSTVLQN